MDRRSRAEQRLEIGGCQRVGIERAEALLQRQRPGKGLLHADLLVEDEADQQRHRVGGDQRVGLIGVGEVQAVGHGPIVSACGLGVPAQGYCCVVPTGESSWFPMPRRDPRRQPRTDDNDQSGSDVNDDAGGPSDEEIGKAVVDCGLYEGGKRRGGRIDLDTALKRAAECTDGWVWIGLHDPSAEVVEAIGEHFQLPPLAVEDAVHAHQRAKLEMFGDTCSR